MVSVLWAQHMPKMCKICNWKGSIWYTWKMRVRQGSSLCPNFDLPKSGQWKSLKINWSKLEEWLQPHIECDPDPVWLLRVLPILSKSQHCGSSCSRYCLPSKVVSCKSWSAKQQDSAVLPCVAVSSFLNIKESLILICNIVIEYTVISCNIL